MITSIIFSKNRPLQLDLTLNTLNKYFTYCNNVIVIYFASDSKFQEGYNILIKERCIFY